MALFLVTLWAVVTVVFFLPRAMPGDPLAGKTDDTGAMSEERRAALETQYNLDQPLVVQYQRYLGDLARGDFGESISGVPVAFLLRSRLPWTALLVGTSIVVSSTISFLAGITSAWRRGRPADRRLLVTMTVLHGVPEYVLATLLFIAFTVIIQAFPLSGGSTPFTNDAGQVYKLADVAYHLVLPATALSLGLLGTKFLLVRNTTISVLGEDYMLAARAKGVPERLLKYRHAGRNVLLPFVTVVGLQVAFATGGALFVETVFGYPGIASLMLPAVEALDFPVLEACFVVLAVLVLSVNLVLELAYGRLDPRVRAE